MQKAINFIEQQLLNQQERDGLIVYSDESIFFHQFNYDLHKHLDKSGFNIAYTTVNPPNMRFLDLTFRIPFEQRDLESRIFLVKADDLPAFDGIRNERIYWVCKLGRISQFSDILIHSLLRHPKSEQEKYIGSFCKESGLRAGN